MSVPTINNGTHPRAPTTPSLKLVYPKLLAGITKSNVSITNCESRAWRCLDEAVSRVPRDGVTHAIIARPLARLSSSVTVAEAGPSFSLPCSRRAISAARARRRASARKETSEAVDETRERVIPASQHLFERAMRRARRLENQHTYAVKRYDVLFVEAEELDSVKPHEHIGRQIAGVRHLARELRDVGELGCRSRRLGDAGRRTVSVAVRYYRQRRTSHRFAVSMLPFLMSDQAIKRARYWTRR
jgi:hypothetical protein